MSKSSIPHTTENESNYCKRVVIIDDEPSILKALDRVLIDEDLLVETFDDAQSALNYCRSNPVAVVLSDARMPDMDGIELLKILAEEYPDIERILLTGYADMESTIAAINKGRVSYYLEKPWNEDRLIRSLNKGVDVANIRVRNRFLEDSLRHKNRQLAEWGASLDQQVQERTEQLREAYLSSVQSISSMVETRLGDRSPNPRTVARLCRQIGQARHFSDKQLRDLRFAALLCHIGKMAFSDDILTTAFVDLTAQQRLTYSQHPAISATTILFVPLLADAADILNKHREQMNGKGYPSHCSYHEICESSFILGLTLFYLECRQGLRFKRPFTHNESCQALQDQTEKMFPSKLVETAIPLFAQWDIDQQEKTGVNLNLHQLKVGMILAQDLHLPDGLLLLAQDKPIDELALNRLVELDHKFPDTMIVSIKP